MCVLVECLNLLKRHTDRQKMERNVPRVPGPINPKIRPSALELSDPVRFPTADAAVSAIVYRVALSLFFFFAIYRNEALCTYKF